MFFRESLLGLLTNATVAARKPLSVLHWILDNRIDVLRYFLTWLFILSESLACRTFQKTFYSFFDLSDLKNREKGGGRGRERGDRKLLPGKLQFHFCDWGKRGRERERDEGRRCDLNGGFHGSTPKRPHEGEERVWKICMHKVHDLGHLFELRVEWTHSSGTSQL